MVASSLQGSNNPHPVRSSPSSPKEEASCFDRNLKAIQSPHFQNSNSIWLRPSLIRRITASSQGVEARNERRPLDRIRNRKSPRSDTPAEARHERRQGATPPIGEREHFEVGDTRTQVVNHPLRFLRSSVIDSPRGVAWLVPLSKIQFQHEPGDWRQSRTERSQPW